MKLCWKAIWGAPGSCVRGSLTVYSDKMKEADVEWYIETFTQGKKHIADFLIEFMALASKAQTDNQHAIFLLKKNVNREIIRAIMAYPPTQAPKSLEQ